MKKLILLFFVIFAFGYQKITYNGYISKVGFNQNYLVAGLENGEVVVKDFKNFKTIYSIKLPKIHDFMDEEIPMPIYSIDLNDDKILILSGGEENSRIVFVFDLRTKKLHKIFETQDSIMRAKFFGKDKIFFAYLSDEVSLFDIKKDKFLYRKQVGDYVFSDLAIYEDKAVIGDESGVVEVVNIKNGKIVTTLQGFNKDQTLSVDIYKNLVINSSSDKRVAIYNINTKNSILELETKFLPYGATITKDKFAVQYDEKNNIGVFDFYKNMKLLKGHTMPLNGMKFINENKLLSFSPAEIIIWRLR